MDWVKCGFIYDVPGTASWARTHAALPVPVHREADIYRVFFSTRADDKRSSIGWVDVEVGNRPRVVAEAEEPAIASGPDGTFDDNSASLGCIVQDSQQIQRLHYMGCNIGTRAPWRNSIGLALGDPAASQFQRFSPGPMMDRNLVDPYSLSYP